MRIIIIQLLYYCVGKSIKPSCERLLKLPSFPKPSTMGLLTEGSPLSWEETKALAEHVRQHGVEQFINLYKKLQDRTGDVLKWGDEVPT